MASAEEDDEGLNGGNEQEDAVVELSVGWPNDSSVPLSESRVITFNCYIAEDIYH